MQIEEQDRDHGVAELSPARTLEIAIARAVIAALGTNAYSFAMEEAETDAGPACLTCGDYGEIDDPHHATGDFCTPPTIPCPDCIVSPVPAIDTGAAPSTAPADGRAGALALGAAAAERLAYYSFDLTPRGRALLEVSKARFEITDTGRAALDAERRDE